MILRFSSLFVSDYRLCHLLRSKQFYYIFILSQKFLSARNFYNISLYKHKFFSSHTRSSEMSVSTQPENVFRGKEDRYEGITVRSDLEPCDVKEFQEKLENSISVWRNDKKRGIWFKVHLNQSDWVPILVKNGFKYHHAKEDFVMLYFWLPSNESHNIPHYAHTMVGVGAVVVNDRNQLLVVQEKYFYKIPRWKLPGGYVEPGENLVDAAIREVAEECGIETQFDSLLSLRQVHYGMFGCSDFYVVVSLKALSYEIVKCEREIAECRWMDIKEYLEHPNIHEMNKFFVQKLLDHKKYNIKIDWHHGVHDLLQKTYTVYSVSKTDEEDAERESESTPSILGENSKSS